MLLESSAKAVRFIDIKKIVAYMLDSWVPGQVVARVFFQGWKK